MKSKSPTRSIIIAATCLISAAYPCVSGAQMIPTAPAATPAGTLAYADIVDLADAAPLVAVAKIRNIVALPSDRAGAVPAGHRRLYIEANVTNLIRGDGGISPAVRYLYDAPVDGRGKIPKLKKSEVILFARRGSRPGEVQLVAPDAQLPATPAYQSQLRAILSELMASGAPPRIIGVGDAFHVAGTIAGEGETQIFLRTETGDPVSLSILRRPGQAPRWAVALGEIVDEAARPPAPGSLLWYRLACTLPQTLPERSVSALQPQDAAVARADYALVIQSLGRCDRSRSGS